MAVALKLEEKKTTWVKYVRLRVRTMSVLIINLWSASDKVPEIPVNTQRNLFHE